MLLTPLDSKHTQKGSDVDAALSQPLFDKGRLILPAGTRLRGAVLQVRPARSFHRNGQLRIAFRQVILPDGAVQTVDTSLQGIESDAAGHVQLDTEGGAKSTPSKTRYLSTGASVGLALIGSGGKNDVGTAGPVAGGATGYKLIGIIVGAVFQNHTYAILMSAYGGGSSIYRNFLARDARSSSPETPPWTSASATAPRCPCPPQPGRINETDLHEESLPRTSDLQRALSGAQSPPAAAQTEKPTQTPRARTRLRSTPKRSC